MASQPFQGGASSAFAIIGMVKSTVVITKEVASAWLSVEQASSMLEKQLKIVELEWSKSKALGHGNEISAAIINQFIGISQPCIKTCVSQLDTCKKKLIGIDINCHTTSKDLLVMIKKTEELKKGFMAEVHKRLDKNPSAKAPEHVKIIEKRLNEYLKPWEDKVEAIFPKLEGELARVKKAQEVITLLIPRVVKLGKLRGLPYKVLDNLLIFTDVALSPLNGNGIVSASADIAANVIPAVGGLAIDKISGVVFDGTLLA